MDRRHRNFLIVELILVTILAVTAFSILYEAGLAEDYTEMDQVFVMCQPDSYVVIRSSPRKAYNESEYGFAGERLYTDWKVKNGYLHVYGPFEDVSGWIKQIYVSVWEPYVYQDGKDFVVVSRYANCRKWMNGPKKGSVKKGKIIKVFLEGAEWCVTNYGYIKTSCLEEVVEQGDEVK